MKTQGIMIGVLVGAVVALGSLLILTNLPSTSARAQGGGGGGGAGSVVALTTEFVQGQNLLYVIDTQAQAILVYGFFTNTASSNIVGMIQRNTTFNLVAGRSYKYDVQLVDKGGYFGRSEPGLDEVRKKLNEIGGGR